MREALHLHPLPRLSPVGFFLKFTSREEAVSLLGVLLPGTEERQDLVPLLEGERVAGCFICGFPRPRTMY